MSVNQVEKTDVCGIQNPGKQYGHLNYYPFACRALKEYEGSILATDER